MAIAQVPGYRVKARTEEVRDYHYDDAKPGKPLHMLIPGGLIALATLSLIVYLLVRVLWEETMAAPMGYGLIALLAPFYIGGVYLFSYGYCLYDVRKAVKMTLIIVFITLAAVVILAVLLILLKDADINIGGGGGGGGQQRWRVVLRGDGLLGRRFQFGFRWLIRRRQPGHSPGRRVLLLHLLHRPTPTPPRRPG